MHQRCLVAYQRHSREELGGLRKTVYLVLTILMAVVVASLPPSSAIAGEEDVSSPSPSTGDSSGIPEVSEPDALDAVKRQIEQLPDFPDVTEADRDRIEAAVDAFDSLSLDEQARLDSEIADEYAYETGQPYGRVLEVAYWALLSLTPQDDATSLADGVYDSTTDPSLSSSYSKGKSTSSRLKPWYIIQVSVEDGRATATIGVASSTYTYMNIGGVHYPRTGGSDGTSEFAGVPIDLNGTLYFSGYSSTMASEIAFRLDNSIDESANEPEPTGLDKARELISALPRDPYEVTGEHGDKILEAAAAYGALDDADRDILDTEVLYRSQSYGRILESAQWALFALAPVDDTTSLADGTYTNKVTAKSSLGKSSSARQRTWSIDKVVVKDGRATATIRWSGNTPLGSLRLGGIEYPNRADDGSSSVFEIPIDLNSTMYFSVRYAATTVDTGSIAYLLSTSVDEEGTQPDLVTLGQAASGEGGVGSGSGNDVETPIRSTDKPMVSTTLPNPQEKSGDPPDAMEDQTPHVSSAAGSGTPAGKVISRAGAIPGNSPTKGMVTVVMGGLLLLPVLGAILFMRRHGIEESI